MEEIINNLKREGVCTPASYLHPFYVFTVFCVFSFARSLCAVRGVFFPTPTSRPFRWLLLIVWGHSMTGYGIQSAGYVLTFVMFDPLLSINWQWNSSHSFNSWLSLVFQKNRPSRLTDSSTAKPSEPNPKGYHSMNHFLGSIIDHVSTNSRRKLTQANWNYMWNLILNLLFGIYVWYCTEDMVLSPMLYFFTLGQPWHGLYSEGQTDVWAGHRNGVSWTRREKHLLQW